MAVCVTIGTYWRSTRLLVAARTITSYIIQAFILFKVLEDSSYSFFIIDCQVVIDIVSIFDEGNQEDSKDTVYDNCHFSIIEHPHQQERTDMKEEKLEHEEMETVP